MPERPYTKLARMWSRATRPPLHDIEHATMEALRGEYKYVCEQLTEYFASPCCDDLQGELAWFQGMNDWLQRLNRVHHEFDVRRHIAAEMRKELEKNV